MPELRLIVTITCDPETGEAQVRVGNDEVNATAWRPVLTAAEPAALGRLFRTASVNTGAALIALFGAIAPETTIAAVAADVAAHRESNP